MIKVIKNTMIEPIEVTCPHCKSILSYTYEDLQREATTNILGLSTGVKIYIVCPVCKGDIDRSPIVKIAENKDE